jgi:DNA-directed RNA polymerase subunit RPC12/RpoP
MKICVECGSEHDDDLGRCTFCGGDLRKRSVSDAINTLLEEGERESAGSRYPCPRCGASVLLRERRGTCSNCGIMLEKSTDADGRPLLIRT